MAEEAKEGPRTFISYSWTSQAHINRVVVLAERLVEDGVHVVLDQWDLREGHDKYAFMEKMVTDPEVTKVLILSDKEYAEKADKKRGGVGTESQIISKEIYAQVTQDKFIPVVLQYDASGNPCLPVFLRNRIYIDFSTPESVEEDYEKLLRTLYGQPALQKPKVGRPPAHIFSEKTSYPSNRSALEAFKTALREDKSNYVPLARQYLDAFRAGLEVFRIAPAKNAMESEFLRSVHDMLPARDELLDFYDSAFVYKDDPALLEVVLEFLEKFLELNYPAPEATSSQAWWFENFAFFNHEAFVYLAAILIRHKRDALLDALMSNQYYVEATARRSLGRAISYTVFCSYSKILELRNSGLERKRLTPEGDLFKQRANVRAVPFRTFMEADFVLFLRSIMHDIGTFGWFPCSVVYADWFDTFPLFARARSDRGFARVATILAVSDRAELKEKVDAGFSGLRGQGWNKLTFHADISFPSLMNYEEITRGTASTQQPDK